MAKEPTRTRRKERKNISSGVAHVNSTFNNTMITITDVQGNAIAWSSAGKMKFKGSRKSTPYAAQVAAEQAGEIAMEHGMKTIEVQVSGPGSGREFSSSRAAVRWSSGDVDPRCHAYSAQRRSPTQASPRIGQLEFRQIRWMVSRICQHNLNSGFLFRSAETRYP